MYIIYNNKQLNRYKSRSIYKGNNNYDNKIDHQFFICISEYIGSNSNNLY